MSRADAIRAIRTATALTNAGHVEVARVCGDGAFDLIDRVAPRELFVQDGQLLHTLLLDDDASIFADVYLCRDEDDFFVLSEGPDAGALCAYLRDASPSGADVRVQNLRENHQMLSIDGPYAWELMAALAGPEIIGLPYLTFYYGDDWTCFRVGKTGEFGYALLVPDAGATALWDRITELGRAFDLVEGDVAALDACALENGFFSMRVERAVAIDPVELQLQWRVSYRKRDYVGAAAMARRRANAQRRTVHVCAGEELEPGSTITCDGAPIGELLAATRSESRGDVVGIALLDRAYAHAGIDGYCAGNTSIHTRSAPLLNNRSLYINPQRHSYATRHEESYPPLVVEGSWLASVIERLS